MQKFIKSFILLISIVCCSILVVGCGELGDYDMSQITLENKTVEYNGLPQTVEIGGSLPNGVSVKYNYYQGETKLKSAPTDVGEYTVVAKFSGSGDYNAIEDKQATLTITKAKLNVAFGSKQILGETGEKETLATPKIFTNHNDGSFTFEFDDNKYFICITNEDAQDYSLALYNSLDEDGNVDELSECDGLVSTIEKPIYAKVDYVGENPSIINNYHTSGMFTIMSTKRTVNLYTASDMAILRQDVEGHSYTCRLNTTYNLMNDIDFAEGDEKGLWNIPAPYYPKNTGLNFCSNFNGNGHTIKNFKITEESLSTSSPVNGNYLTMGFFGFVTDAHIYDVNFSDFVVDVDCYKVYENLLPFNDAAIPQQTFFGLVAARVDDNFDKDMQSTYITKFENITAENGDIKINTANKAFCGIMLGSDSTGGDEYAVRENLDVKNVRFSVINAHGAEAPLSVSDAFRIGGLVGEVGERGKGVEYLNCDLDGVEVLVGAHEEGQVETAKNMRAGAFIGHNRSDSRLTNCNVTNFVVACYYKSGLDVKMGGYYGLKAKTTKLEIVNCTHSNPKTSEELGFETETGLVGLTKTETDWAATDKQWDKTYEPQPEPEPTPEPTPEPSPEPEPNPEPETQPEPEQGQEQGQEPQTQQQPAQGQESEE